MSAFRRFARLLAAVCALLVSVPALALAQGTGQLSGVVTDSGGTPMDGVRVSIVGTSIVAGTTPAGRYTFSRVEPGAHTVRARVLGYTAKELTVTVVAGQTVTANFRLVRAPLELERVIVSTGYGQQTKATTTGASDVIGGEDLQKRPVSNINKGLQGLMPGVTVQDFGGRPGGDQAQIRIRGQGTLGNSGALILVDGVVGEIANLDPLDIESVSVLKDAASATIYGARAANGVILVKTRRGRNTGGLKMSYDGYVASQEAADTPERVDIRTELNTINQVYTYNGQPAKYRQGYIDSVASGVDPDKYPNTNWLALILRKAPMTNQTVRVSGGNDLASLSLSGNSFDQQGILNAETYYKRFTLRANGDYRISKRLSAVADLMLMNERVVRPLGEGAAFFDAFHDTPPTQAAVYSDGTYGLTSGKNPYAELREYGYNNSRWRTAQVNTALTYAMENGLKFNAQYTGLNKDFRQLEFTPFYQFADRSNPTNYRLSSTRTGSNDGRNTDFTTDLQLTGEYERSFGLHTTHALAGYEQRQSDNDNNSAFRGGAYNNDLQLPNSGDITFIGNSGGASTNRLLRSFGRLNYGWNNKYLFEANVSRDGSSRFGSSKRFGVFPSVSAAWRVSDEGIFRDHIGMINDLKLRASWGRAGNDQIGDYLYQQTININAGNYNYGGVLSPGATPGRIANPDIGWETTEQTNGGVDLEMFQGRLSFTGDMYNKITTGILLGVPISTLVGQTAPVQNAASIANHGWETALNFRNQIGSLTYQIGFNLSDNKNRITNLPGGDQINVDLAPSIRRVGEPYNAIYGVKAVGIFQTAAEVAAWPAQNPGKTAAGDLKYLDQNGDGKIDGNDRVVIGDRTPHYTYGIPLALQFKAFDFSVLMQGVGHLDTYLSGALIQGPTYENFFATYLLDTWTPDNPNAKWPRFALRSSHNTTTTDNSWWVRDARYLNLKNVNFGFTVPPRLITRYGFSSARIYAAGSNLYTWSELKGLLPPEQTNSTNRGNYYFQTRNVSLGASFGL